jgi:hypothetical protein
MKINFLEKIKYPANLIYAEINKNTIHVQQLNSSLLNQIKRRKIFLK